MNLTLPLNLPARRRRARRAVPAALAAVALAALLAPSLASASQPVPPGADAAPAGAVNDPWEGWNRAVHGFNNGADRWVLRPLAVAYDTVTPQPVQGRIANFFANLGGPVTVVNQLLQGRPVDAGQSLGRFAVNTTVGLAGLFDPAEDIGLQRSRADFGHTMATWGWEDSRYLVLPLMGPRTLRDALGEVADSPLQPLGAVDNSTVSAALKTLELASGRTRLFALDEARRAALDDYALVRDAWMQRRNGQIRDGRPVKAE